MLVINYPKWFFCCCRNSTHMAVAFVTREFKLNFGWFDVKNVCFIITTRYTIEKPFTHSYRILFIDSIKVVHLVFVFPSFRFVTFLIPNLCWCSLWRCGGGGRGMCNTCSFTLSFNKQFVCVIFFRLKSFPSKWNTEAAGSFHGIRLARDINRQTQNSTEQFSSMHVSKGNFCHVTLFSNLIFLSFRNLNLRLGLCTCVEKATVWDVHIAILSYITYACGTCTCTCDAEYIGGVKNLQSSLVESFGII